MSSVNVLIADHQNCCAFFLRSVLSSEGFGVSLSFDSEQTMAKISTGLFDAVLCAFDCTDETSVALLGEITATVPGMPVVIVRKMGQPVPQGFDLHASLTLPLAVAAVSRVMAKVRDCVTSTDNRRIHPRKRVNLAAEITAGGRRIFCRATNLSRGGLQVETVERSKLRKGLEALFREPSRAPVLARLFLGKSRIIEFEASLAYIERFRFRAPEQIGLAFATMGEEQKSELERFLVEVG